MINVIIPVHNRIKYTIECISSLKQQDCIDDLKIFLVDDGSTDQTTEIITKKFPDVKIFQADGSLFWGGAINFGINRVLKDCDKDDWILLVNNDVEFQYNSISNLLEQSIKYKRKSISGSLTVSFKDKKSIIKSGTIVKNWFLNLTSHQFVNDNIELLINKKSVEVDFLTGRCLLHPVEIFEVVGNYDSKTFPHYGADDEFSMRVKKFGYSSILCPSSIVYLKENDENRSIKTSLLNQFLFSLFNIKSSANIVNKFNLSLKVVPIYAKPSFFLIGILKSIIIFFRNVTK